jgi:dTDP-4-dehydrorhamnose reductase
MSSLKKSLIVGAAGQVGRQIVRVLGAENVISAGRHPNPGWVHLDLAELSNDPQVATRVLAEEDIQAVYCVGGATDVERCEADTTWAYQTNHLGPAVLASLCAHVPFVYFSTEYVFDGASGPYAEMSPLNPICVYGRSKALGEQAILEAHPSPLILRTTVVYGDDPGGKNFLYSLRRILGEGKQMRVPADQVSTPTYNRDLALASTMLVEQRSSGVFHVCGPDLLNRYEFAVRCANLMGLDANLVVGVPTSSLNQKAPRPLNAGLVSHRLQHALPHLTMRSFERGVADWLHPDK